MLGEDVEVPDGVDGQQRVVGHDHIGLPGTFSGSFREAVRAEGAAGDAYAFSG